MDEFYRTKMGRQFFDGHIPNLISVLERIANSLEILIQRSVDGEKEKFAKE